MYFSAPPEQINVKCLAKSTLCLPSSPRPQHHADPESIFLAGTLLLSVVHPWSLEKAWRWKKYAATQSIAAVAKDGTFSSLALVQGMEVMWQLQTPQCSLASRYGTWLNVMTCLRLLALPVRLWYTLQSIGALLSLLLKHNYTVVPHASF